MGNIYNQYSKGNLLGLRNYRKSDFYID